MATGDKRVEMFINMLLSKTAMYDWFLSYLNTKQDDIVSGLFSGLSGTLDTQAIGLAADGNDMFKFDLTNASKVVVSGGQIIDLLQQDLDSYTKKIQFQNTAATDYEIYVKYALVPEEIDLDRKGIPNYIAYMDTFGEYSFPDSVTDTPGVQIKIVIDTLTEAAVSNAGRKCRAMMLIPLSASKTVAFYEATVQWDGANNYIVIPYAGANGPLGQDTGSGPPSTTAADYRVWVYGPTVKRLVSLKANKAYAYIGDVTGGGAGAPPAGTDVSTQYLLWFLTLDKAYDGIGSGGGRVIDVDSGPVELQMYTGSVLRPDLDSAQLYKDMAGITTGKMERFGRYVDCRRFIDDFHYRAATWITGGGVDNSPPHLYASAEVGAGGGTSLVQVFNGVSPANLAASGFMKMKADIGAVSNYAKLSGPNTIRIRELRPGLYFRFAYDYSSAAANRVILRLKNGMVGAALPDNAFGIIIDNTNMKGAAWDATGLPSPVYDPAVVTGANLITGMAALTIVDVYVLVTGPTTCYFWATGMTTPEFITLPFNIDTVAYDEMAYWYLEAIAITMDAVNLVIIYLDRWEFWSRGLLPAP